jgi:hypothetical protein
VFSAHCFNSSYLCSCNGHALSFAGYVLSAEEPTYDHENADCDRYVLHDVMVERRQKKAAEDHGHCHCDHGNFEQIDSEHAGRLLIQLPI